MIALDTNVLVRYLVEDDKRQSAEAAALIERAIAADEMLFVPDIVLCEVAWVLTASYKTPRPELVRVLRELLRAKHLAFATPDRLIRALDALSAGRGDFADYVIREQARAAECEHVATFDKRLQRERGFVPAR